MQPTISVSAARHRTIDSLCSPAQGNYRDKVSPTWFCLKGAIQQPLMGVDSRVPWVHQLSVARWRNFALTEVDRISNSQ